MVQQFLSPLVSTMLLSTTAQWLSHFTQHARADTFSSRMTLYDESGCGRQKMALVKVEGRMSEEQCKQSMHDIHPKSERSRE